jgi:hypothetical protein
MYLAAELRDDPTGVIKEFLSNWAVGARPAGLVLTKDEEIILSNGTRDRAAVVFVTRDSTTLPFAAHVYGDMLDTLDPETIPDEATEHHSFAEAFSTACIAIGCPLGPRYEPDIIAFIAYVGKLPDTTASHPVWDTPYVAEILTCIANADGDVMGAVASAAKQIDGVTEAHIRTVAACKDLVTWAMTHPHRIPSFRNATPSTGADE